MEEGTAAHNCASMRLEGAALTHVEAQQALAGLINKLGATAACYWWTLLGDEPNSLCHFLDMSCNDVRLTLRKCRVLCGAADSFRTSEFENLISKIGCDYSIYRPKGKPTCFLKIGDNIDDVHSVDKPKEMCSVGGILERMPVLSVHLPGVRTKISRKLATNLIMGSSNGFDTSTSSAEAFESDTNKQNNKGSMTICINDLIDVVRKEIMHASRQGQHCNFTQRAERMLRKAAAVAIKGSLRDLVDAWVEQIGNEKEAEECLSTPAVSAPGQRTNIFNSELRARAIFPSGDSPAIGTDTQEPSTTLITPPVDLTADEEEADERDVDIVLSQLKEETILQNLLHKRLVMNNQRVVTLEHKNGRKFCIILPPECQSLKAFVEEAKKSQWMRDMLHTDIQKRGMLLCLAQTHPEKHLRVANQKKMAVNTHALNTPQTLALGCLSGINDTQLQKIRSFLRNIGKTELKHSKKEIERIDADVGLHKSMPVPLCSNCTLEWSTTSGKGVEKKPPEQCSFWNCDILLEVAAEIDLLLLELFLEEPDLKTIPLLDYPAPGFDVAGIVALFGGDHGAGSCPCHLKINFSSPQVRKERGELNCRCPTVQIASIQCSKDSFESLSHTVMPKTKQQLIELRNSCACVVCSVKSPGKCRKAFLLPKNCDRQNMLINDKTLCYQTGIHQRTIDLRTHFAAEDVASEDLRVSTIVSNFHDLCVGDLAFLAMVIGVNNSAGHCCVHCQKGSKGFNCDQTQPQHMRTKASLANCLNKHNARRMTNKGTRNHLGVNNIGLLDVDPQRIIVPILHCPMGLVDKVLETFKLWSISVESLPDESNQIREAHHNTQAAWTAAVALENEAKILNEQQRTANSATLLRDATETRGEAKAAERKAKLVYDEMVKRHNSRLFSLSQSFDTVLRSNNTKKEHCHGGKCNGVNCVRIVDKAQVLFAEFAATTKQKKVATVSDDEIDAKCSTFSKLLALLDVIWSSVRGIEAGLLPTTAQSEELRSVVSNTKQLWLSMGMGAMQPKWHMTFDGHLVDQAIKCGGLADKSDESVEFQHQLLKKLRDRHRSIPSFQRREECIRRDLRRRRSPEMQKQIKQCEAAKKVKPDSKRQLASDERQQEVRAAKRTKREAILED